MKKLLLLLITLTTFTNVSYVSFPVNQNTQTEVVETIESPNYGNSQPIWAILSFSFLLLGLISVPFVPLTFLFSLLAIIFGAIGFNKKLKGLAITSFVLGLILLILTLVFIVLVLLYGGVGAAFGG